MLQSLSIREVVLIEKLELTFGAGLGVLTGETGAGKSILLDALGLALGVRAEARLVRHGAKQASVTASFDVDGNTGIQALLDEQGLEIDDGLMILRRVLSPDGRSRAFVNDQPVGVALLKTLGEALVEIHGQFESRRLLSPANHRGLLDQFGGLKAPSQATQTAWQTWRTAADAHAKARQDMAAAARDEEYLRHAVDELEAIEPQAGEEDDLAARRALMMHGEKLQDAMTKALQDLSVGDSAEALLRKAQRRLEAVAEVAEGRLTLSIDALERAAIEAAEGHAQLEAALGSLDMDPKSLEDVEERLFTLRALGRKHDVPVDDLARLLGDMQAKLTAVEDGGAQLAELARAEAAAKETYLKAAQTLSDGRAKAATKLDAAVAVELVPLKLEKAAFSTALEALGEDDWGSHGIDGIAFQVATNPGAPPGPLNKIASGGELARLMLALKAVLAERDRIATIIFDEVDAGVGGAVAAAVGERLAGLAASAQVLVVTHSPQVASIGAYHWRVSKAGTDAVVTSVDTLSEDERKEEIARMLAGTNVTDEARAAADSLLQEAAL
ncbi:MAG: DNA repair protein RecN [Rhodospirillaceae bacterium]|jgi:DNA repair protein RecN (Recombination protein N)|nr:DNA repair protein RecN [Rhodospirillaceae bacterium]MBT7356747.1 DNA repair protein RecN [Rhodospirillaceae bacterium]